MGCFGSKPKETVVTKSFDDMTDEEKLTHLQNQIGKVRSKVVKGESDQRALDEMTEDAILRKFKASESKEPESYIEQLTQKVNENIRKRLLCKQDLIYYRNQKIVIEDLEVTLRRKIEQKEMKGITDGSAKVMKDASELEKKLSEGIRKMREQQEIYEIERKENPLNDPNGIYSPETRKEMAEMEASYVKRYNEKNGHNQPIGAITGD